MRLICQHCSADLGPVIDGEPQPTCPDHPNGSVYTQPDEPTEEAQ
jgi:hypothetical protein